MDLGLKDKVAIVTGSGRGIGAETARALAEEGARVVVTDIDAQVAADHCAALQRDGFQAIAITFSFITFTRFWFRSPTLEHVDLMLGQIGGDFGWHLAGDVLWGFRSVFAMMLLGFVVHWLPERMKQGYRARFAALPLWGMALRCV